MSILLLLILLQIFFIYPKFNEGEQCIVHHGKYLNHKVNIISPFDKFEPAVLMQDTMAVEYVVARISKLNRNSKFAFAARIKLAQERNEPIERALAKESVANSYKVKLENGQIAYIHESELTRVES